MPLQNHQVSQTFSSCANNDTLTVDIYNFILRLSKECIPAATLAQLLQLSQQKASNEAVSLAVIALFYLEPVVDWQKTQPAQVIQLHVPAETRYSFNATNIYSSSCNVDDVEKYLEVKLNRCLYLDNPVFVATLLPINQDMAV
jgi:hypothetical protein